MMEPEAERWYRAKGVDDTTGPAVAESTAVAGAGAAAAAATAPATAAAGAVVATGLGEDLL